MFDRANNELFVGDKVMIVRCDEYPTLVGRIATVMEQDESSKICVSLSDQWQGYFCSVDIEKYIEDEIEDEEIDEGDEKDLIAINPNPKYKNWKAE